MTNQFVRQFPTGQHLAEKINRYLISDSSLRLAVIYTVPVSKIGGVDYEAVVVFERVEPVIDSAEFAEPTVNQMELKLLVEGHKILAIKSVRNRLGFHLKDAKDLVEGNYKWQRDK